MTKLFLLIDHPKHWPPFYLARHIEKHLHQYENMAECDYVKYVQELLAADLSEILKDLFQLMALCINTSL